MGEFSFPEGTGASSRVLNYAKGLRANGALVKVLCVEPIGSEGGSGAQAARGEYKGIPYEYTYGRTTRPASRWLRGLLKASKYWRFLAATRRWAADTGGLDVIVVYTRLEPWIAMAWLACRLSGATLLHEDCELPFVWAPDTRATRIRRWLYEHIAFRTFDACLVISRYLDDYCRRHLRRGARTLLVPILVDVADAGTPVPTRAGWGCGAPTCRPTSRHVCGLA